jgi:hypothetical protein
MLESVTVSVHSKPLLPGLIFAAILLGALDPRPLFTIHREPASDRFEEYPRFLAEVASRTAAGQSIAIAAPERSRILGSSYIFHRASYCLAGRRVIPLIDRDDSQHFERIGEADFVAVWGTSVPPGRLAVFWRGRDGTLYRRVR